MLQTISHKEQKLANSTTIAIREFIETSNAVRMFDEQSGFRVVFTPKYRVSIYKNNLEQVLIMSMKDVYELYPWFFGS